MIMVSCDALMKLRFNKERWDKESIDVFFNLTDNQRLAVFLQAQRSEPFREFMYTTKNTLIKVGREGLEYITMDEARYRFDRDIAGIAALYCEANHATPRIEHVSIGENGRIGFKLKQLVDDFHLENEYG